MFYNYLLFYLHRIIIKPTGIKFYNAAAVLDSVIIKCVDGIAKHMAQNTAEAAGAEHVWSAGEQKI